MSNNTEVFIFVQQFTGRRMAIYGARPFQRNRRPIRPYLRPRKKPNVVFGVLQNVPSPPRRADVVYPYGIGGKYTEIEMGKVSCISYWNS